MRKPETSFDWFCLKCIVAGGCMFPASIAFYIWFFGTVPPKDLMGSAIWFATTLCTAVGQALLMNGIYYYFWSPFRSER